MQMRLHVVAADDTDANVPLAALFDARHHRPLAKVIIPFLHRSSSPPVFWSPPVLLFFYLTPFRAAGEVKLNTNNMFVVPESLKKKKKRATRARRPG
jgi:hypothetical protein